MKRSKDLIVFMVIFCTLFLVGSCDHKVLNSRLPEARLGSHGTSHGFGQGSGRESREELHCERSVLHPFQFEASKTTDNFLNPASWKEIKRVFIVMLENTDARVALRQPFLGQLAKSGAVLSNFYAISHPSQPNYVALISGDTQGVDSDSKVNLDACHIGDLLRVRGKKWRTYAEDFPGGCFLAMESGYYARRHVPFLSFNSVSGSPEECANVVQATQLDRDIQEGHLADFSIYVPNNRNNGHDTGVAFADRALFQRFGSLLKNQAFLEGTLFIVTFDESLTAEPNKVYAAFFGAGVQPGTVSNQPYNFFGLLATVEKILDIGTLGNWDSQSSIINDIWKP